MLKMKKNEKGFTLVEVLVVIAIIGVLATLIVPSVINYVKRANRAHDKVTARLIGTTVTELLIEDPTFADVFYGKGPEMDYSVCIDGEPYMYRNICRCDGAKTCIEPGTAAQKWRLTRGQAWDMTSTTFEYTMKRLNTRIDDVVGGSKEMSYIPMRSSSYEHPAEDCNHDENYYQAKLEEEIKKAKRENREPNIESVKAGTRNRDTDATDRTHSYTDRWLIGYRLQYDTKKKKWVPDTSSVEVWAGDSHGKGDNGPRVRLWPSPPSYY